MQEAGNKLYANESSRIQVTYFVCFLCTIKYHVVNRLPSSHLVHLGHLGHLGWVIPVILSA